MNANNTSVNINKVISVANSVVSAYSSGFIPQGLLLTRNTILPTQTVEPFKSVNEVGAYFGTTSLEYENANKYFVAETININTPPSLYFARYTDTEVAPYIRGSALNVSVDLPILQAITAGSMTVNFAGNPTTISGVDLSGDASFSAIASTIQAKLITAGLTTATCTFDTTTKSITISNGVVNTAVNYVLDSSLANALKITHTLGAVLSQGLDVQTPADNMNYIVSQTRNWVTFTTNFDASLENAPYPTITGLIEWNNSQGKNYIYLPWTKNSNCVAFPQSTASLPYYLATNGWGIVAPTGEITFNSEFSVYYSDIDFICGQMGTVASVNYNTSNATKALDAKTYSGVIPLVVTDQQYDMALLNGCNCYVKFSSRANSYIWSETGEMGGQFLWIDNLVNQAWLNDAITVAEANLKGSLPILPFTNLSPLKAVILEVCNRGIINGVISAGNTFSAQQIAELKQQFDGLDITPTLTASGYYVLIGTPTAESRAQRKLAPIKIAYSSGGSVRTISNILTQVI
jgi:hypothetical protein